jgi:serine/threonine protein kinase/formylglycine-generating enzyme required for sulfatase activity
MDKQLWQNVEDLFHKALQVEDSKRTQFVKERAPEDRQLQFEVLTLLKSHESESDFLEQAANPDWSDSLKKITNEFESGALVPANGSSNPSTGSKSAPTENNACQQTKSQAGSHFPNTFEIGISKRIEDSHADLVVKKVINRGGMGTVLRVYQRKLDRDVAVKVLSVDQVDDVMRRRFVRESKAAAQVKNDHVVGIHEVCNDPELPFLVMELIDGPSLKRYIELESGLAPTTAAEFARQIAIGLAAAHERHLIHRDIKPANVLLEPYTPKLNENFQTGYRAKIIDFGLARDEDNPTGETQDQLFAGTLYYMSPEQLAKPDNVDHRSDIYSLGVTLYQMLTGEAPFRGAPHMVMRKIELTDPTSPRRLDDRIPRDLESVCKKAMAKDPSRRYQTAQTFADDLARFLEGLPTEARPITTSEKLGRWIARNKRVSAFAGLAASLLVLLTIGSLIFAFTVNHKDQQIDAQGSTISNLDRTINLQRDQTVEIQVQRVLDAEASALPFAIADLDLNHEDTLVQFRSAFESPDNDTNRRFNAAVVLSQAGSTQTDFILEHLDQLYVTPDVFAATITALQRDPDAVAKLSDSIGDLDRLQKKELENYSKRIILSAHLGDFGPWIRALDNKLDLSVNTEIVHTFRNWHGDLVSLCEAIENQPNEQLKWAICQAIYLVDRRSFNQHTFEKLVEVFERQVDRASDFVGYTSAQQLLKKWDITPASRKTGPNDQWYERDNGIRMVKIDPSTSRMGRLERIKKFIGFPPHDVTITRPFYIADAEVTVAQYQEFLRDKNYPSDKKPVDCLFWSHSIATSPTLNHPVQTVSWYDAAMFCNWLSEKEGLTPAYKRSGNDFERVIYLVRDNQSYETEHWEFEDQANGYRMPHEHEFGLATRAGSQSKFFYGSQTEFFDHYGLSSNNTRLASSPVRSRLPNQFGLYDLHGNFWEWCNDWFSHLDESHLTDPIGPIVPDPEPNPFGRSIRGGGVGSASGDTDSDARGAEPPHNRHENLTFRVARYAELTQ